MEKKYLEIRNNGKAIGAFENVRNFAEEGDTLRFDSDDGSFEFKKNAQGKYVDVDGNFPYDFDSFQYEGRRTVLRHRDKLTSDQIFDPRGEAAEEGAVIIPAPYDEYYEIDDYEPGRGEYKVGDIIDNYKCHVLAYLKAKDEDSGVEPSAFLVDDPDYPVCYVVNGRLYSVDLPGEDAEADEFRGLMLG